MDGTFWGWMALAGLGAFHGINPGMGWLFAVALGMQERSGSAVWRSLLPLGLGHALAVGVAVLIAVAAGAMIPLSAMRWPVALFLIGMGVYRLFRGCHSRFGGMRVGFRGLTAWSFLMATAHGAGLMVVPVFLGMAPAAEAASCHAHASAAGTPMTAFLATGIHGLGYLAVTAAAAWLVFEKLGVGLLRKAWFNLDVIWACALIATGVLTFTL
ncbi:MAG: hypothetical protein IPM24_16295 [Bryobacterales bacterium]|nr:hypothetical protein [Bryobacterales bacterium]